MVWLETAVVLRNLSDVRKKPEITFTHEVVERKLLKEEKPTEATTKGSHEIGGNHGNMSERFLEPACDLEYGKLPMGLFSSLTWFPIGKY